MTSFRWAGLAGLGVVAMVALAAATESFIPSIFSFVFGCLVGHFLVRGAMEREWL